MEPSCSTEQTLMIVEITGLEERPQVIMKSAHLSWSSISAKVMFARSPDTSAFPNAEKPSAPCLSSRVPYGTAITPEILLQVGRAERTLRELGFREFRVRHHNEIARLEFLEEDFKRAIELASTIEERLVGLGYRYVALDLGGYRTGSLNRVLTQISTSERAMSNRANMEENQNDLKIDLDRLRRCGHPESVYSPGKRPDQIVRALRTLHASDGTALATRCSATVADEVRDIDPEIIYEPVSRTLRLGSPTPNRSSRTTVVVSAGTSDLPFAEEAAVTLEDVWLPGKQNQRRRCCGHRPSL